MKVLLTAIYPYIFMMLYLIIPFDEYARALPNILMAFLIISFPFVVNKEDFKKLLIQPTIILILFYAYLLVNSLFQGTFSQDFSIINKMMIPIALALLYLPIGDFKKLKKAIVFSSFIAIVFTLFKFVVSINNNAEVSLHFFQETVDALLIDRLYIGLLCILSILTSYQFLSKKYHPDNTYYLSSIVINVLYLFLIMSKTALIILIALVLLRQFFGPKKNIRLGISFGILFLILALGYSSIKKTGRDIINSKDHISEISYNESSIPLGYRIFIWDCMLLVVKDLPNNCFGIGFKETTNNMVTCYEENISDALTKNTFVKQRFNTHNQYADFYLGSGIIGLLMFLGVLIYLLVKYRKHYYPLALVITVVLFGMVESYLNRQVGAYYIGFILVMLLINYDQLKEVKD